MREQLARVGSEDQAQVDRLGGLSPWWPGNKCYFLLSHLSGPDINQTTRTVLQNWLSTFKF